MNITPEQHEAAIRQAKAQAWDEGFSAAWYEALPYEDSRDASESKTPNPYIEETK